MYEQIPVSVLEQYEGQWIIWDQDEKKVVGWGKTLDEAEDQAEKVKTDHLLRVHHVLPRDWEIAGML
jgi:predicted RNase H-like HicB family nuclease